MNYLSVELALSLVSGDLYDIATQTQEIITLEQARVCHGHLESILRQLVHATRIGTQTDPWLAGTSIPRPASTTCPSSTETRTACQSTPIRDAC